MCRWQAVTATGRLVASCFLRYSPHGELVAQQRFAARDLRLQSPQRYAEHGRCFFMRQVQRVAVQQRNALGLRQLGERARNVDTQRVGAARVGAGDQ